MRVVYMFIIYIYTQYICTYNLICSYNTPPHLSDTHTNIRAISMRQCIKANRHIPPSAATVQLSFGCQTTCSCESRRERRAPKGRNKGQGLGCFGSGVYSSGLGPSSEMLVRGDLAIHELQPFRSLGDIYEGEALTPTWDGFHHVLHGAVGPNRFLQPLFVG